MASQAHTVRSTAQQLQLSERKTRELIATGELGSIKIGRSRRVTDAQIDAFLRGKEQQAVNAA